MVCWASAAQTHLLIISSLWGKSQNFWPLLKHLLFPVLCVNYFLASGGTLLTQRKDWTNLLDGSFVQCCGSAERIYGFMAHEIVLDPSERRFSATSVKGKGLPPCSATYYMHVQTQLLFAVSIFAAGWITSGDWTIWLLFSRVQKFKDSRDVSMSGCCLDLVWSKIRMEDSCIKTWSDGVTAGISVINLNRICCILFCYSHKMSHQNVFFRWGGRRKEVFHPKSEALDIAVLFSLTIFLSPSLNITMAV